MEVLFFRYLLVLYFNVILFSHLRLLFFFLPCSSVSYSRGYFILYRLRIWHLIHPVPAHFSNIFLHKLCKRGEWKNFFFFFTSNSFNDRIFHSYSFSTFRRLYFLFFSFFFFSYLAPCIFLTIILESVFSLLPPTRHSGIFPGMPYTLAFEFTSSVFFPFCYGRYPLLHRLAPIFLYYHFT